MYQNPVVPDPKGQGCQFGDVFQKKAPAPLLYRSKREDLIWNLFPSAVVARKAGKK